MDKRAALEAIKSFANRLQINGVNPGKIILYGSYACGNYHEGSDIDLVVVSKDFEDKDYWQRIDKLSNAIYDVFEPIEAVAMTPGEWNEGKSFVCELAKNGEILEFS